MSIRIFNKVLLNFKYGNGIFLKYSRSIHCVSDTSPLHVHKNLFSNNKVLVAYFSNKRNFSSIPNDSSHQQIYPKILSYNKDTVLIKRIPINYHPIAVSSIRHYSNSTPTFVGETITYNSGIFETISESIFVKWITELLRLMHYETGLPWWASIILATFLTRTVVSLPLNILDLQNRVKQENLVGEMKEISLRLQRKVEAEIASAQLPPKRALVAFTRYFSEERGKLYIRDNCHPFKSVAIILLQAPVWLCFSVTVRNMCFMLPYKNSATLQDFNEFTTGGFGWIQNLTEIDHLFVLPLLFGISSLALIEINQLLFGRTATKFTRVYKNILRVLTICFVPLTAYLPSCLALFWVTNNFCTILQNLLLLSPKFRRIVGIPKTNLEVQKPYSKLYQQFTFKKSTA